MQWTNFSEIQSRFDPQMNLNRQQMTMRHYQEQAKLDQIDRHHRERVNIENRRLEANSEAVRENARAIVDRETIAGKNALQLADRNHILGQMTQGSQLIDSMIHSQLKQEEEWNNIVADTMRQLLVSDAEKIKQAKLKELDHRHKIEVMQLEYNLKLVEMFLENEIRDSRVTFDKSIEVIFKVIERCLGLGEQDVSRDDVSSWVNEAMGQAHR